MYLKQNIALYPPLRTRCDGQTLVRLTEDWPPQMRLAFPVPAGVAPIRQQFAVSCQEKELPDVNGLTLAVAY
jgi:hypothetical protein